ncbi:sulfatase-like hydrolase/transferase [uncultured Tateyamaria sp.]|uniref:sulfatase-like hydrolase/transferase n=1 Tax=uncultured Tateyamaria sp. TaxID=455651 RepID=UPI0026388247|nr:sulfatase-like hydrolase/transferase [uncultured Tateyamaria sp.]
MNVLFLMADELSWWALGHHDPRIHTAHLDRLAARGMRFDAAYTPSPICVPTRAAIATGKYVHEIGNWSSAEPYDGATPSWGHVLRDVGIDPVSIGKLHYQSGDADCGFGTQIAPVHVVDGIGWAQALLRRPVEPYDMTHTLARDIGPGDTAYLAQDRTVTAAACDWIAAPARQNAPWCAFVSWLAPHFPLTAPPQDYALYDPQALARGAQEVPDHPILREIAGFFDHDPYFTPESRGIATASYFGLCTFLDRQVGRVLDALDAAGLTEDTLVVFTADHGEMLGEKGFWTKSTMYDSAARVPLMLAGPGIDAGTCATPVSLIDIAPTICGTLGARTSGFSGRDLRRPDPDRTVLSEYHDGGCSVGVTMVRWGTWKMVHYAEGHAAQLFDMAADPQEEVDLAIARPDIIAEGTRRMLALVDPEDANARAHADQARRIAALGGIDAIRAIPTFDYTPADSR